MFTPRSAVLVHIQVEGLDEAVFGILKAEENLLIHKCSPHADRKTKEWINTAGTSVLRVDSEETLVWDVAASVLKQSGLANYHPGRKLSEQAVLWANGGALPFQFKMGTHGIWIYEAPTLEPPPGDLPGISFRIRCQFAEFDGDNYIPEPPPDIEPPPGPVDPPVTVPPVPPVGNVDLPYQPAFPLVHAIGRDAMLQDVWTFTELLGPFPFTAQMFNGDPLAFTPGVAVTSVVELVPWTDLVQDATYPYGALARCAEFISPGATGAARTVTHVLFKRGDVVVGNVVLAAPFIIPAGNGVRVPAGALGLRLLWSMDNLAGHPPLEGDTRPWFRYLRYVCGSNRVELFFSNVVMIEIFEYLTGDRLDAWLVPASPEHWGVVGDTVGAAGLGHTGVRVAPPAGFTWDRIRISTGGSGMDEGGGGSLSYVVLCDEVMTPVIPVAGGQRAHLATGALLPLLGPPDA